jgi:hypothetical protein
MRPTGRPPRHARKSSTSACSKNGVAVGVQMPLSLGDQRRHPAAGAAIELERQLDEAASVAAGENRSDLDVGRGANDRPLSHGAHDGAA